MKSCVEQKEIQYQNANYVRGSLIIELNDGSTDEQLQTLIKSLDLQSPRILRNDKNEPDIVLLKNIVGSQFDTMCQLENFSIVRHVNVGQIAQAT